MSDVGKTLVTDTNSPEVPATPNPPVETPPQPPADSPASNNPQDTASKLYDNQQEKPGEKPSGETEKPPEIKYELKLPENSLINEQRRDEIVSFAKEQGLSNEAAQKILESEHNAVKSFENTRVQEFETLKNNWAEAAKADPEIGGEKFTENIQFAKDAIKKFGSQQLFEFFDQSGFGNHPELVRVFAKIGRAMDAGSIVHGSTEPPKPDMAERFYGGTTN